MDGSRENVFSSIWREGYALGLKSILYGTRAKRSTRGYKETFSLPSSKSSPVCTPTKVPSYKGDTRFRKQNITLPVRGKVRRYTAANCVAQATRHAGKQSQEIQRVEFFATVHGCRITCMWDFCGAVDASFRKNRVDFEAKNRLCVRGWVIKCSSSWCSRVLQWICLPCRQSIF